MFKSTIIIICLIVGSSLLAAQSPSLHPEEQAYKRLQILSGCNLNISLLETRDSLVDLCHYIEKESRNVKDSNKEFKVGQILVNTDAASGNITKAVDRAHRLYEQACEGSDSLNTGLAMQALGDTYLFSNHFARADSMFTLALSYIASKGDKFMITELLLQRLHVRIYMSDIKGAEDDVETLYKLIEPERTLINESNPHQFLLHSYDALLAIKQNDLDRVRQILPDIENHKHSRELSDLWRYYIRSEYHTAMGESDKALIYADSTLMIVQRGSNANLLYNIMMLKAGLLYKVDKSDLACSLFQQIVLITDTLHKTQYISQIDSLHSTYWIDQMLVTNITQRNKLYATVIIGLVVLVIITIVIVLMIRCKNRQLIQSRQELEAMRVESDDSLRTKSLFLSNMSHELRTPLNAITGFSTILTDEEDVDESTRMECSNYIHQNADLLMKLINDVVDFSELKDNSFKFLYETCDVVVLCHNVLMTVNNVKRTRAETHFETSLEHLEIITDKNRLQQVLINLLINSTKFTKEGTITLRLESDLEHSQAIFTVEDTGCGIPLDKQSSIFERFEKLHEGIQGAGLGLSICKLIISHAGGDIWVDSEYKQGARFVFTLPFIPKNS